MLRRGRRLHAVVYRVAELLREFAVDLARIAAHPGRDLCRQQRRDEAVFVGRPDRAIPPEKRRPGALFATEAQHAGAEAIDEPLEAHRHLVELPAQGRGDAIDHLATHHRLAHRRVLAPLRSVLEEVEDGDRQVVIGRQ